MEVGLGASGNREFLPRIIAKKSFDGTIKLIKWCPEMDILTICLDKGILYTYRLSLDSRDCSSSELLWKKILEEKVYTMCWSWSGKLLAVSMKSGKVVFLEGVSGEEISSLEYSDKSPVSMIAWSAKQETAADTEIYDTLLPEKIHTDWRRSYSVKFCERGEPMFNVKNKRELSAEIPSQKNQCTLKTHENPSFLFTLHENGVLRCQLHGTGTLWQFELASCFEEKDIQFKNHNLSVTKDYGAIFFLTSSFCPGDKEENLYLSSLDCGFIKDCWNQIREVIPMLFKIEDILALSKEALEKAMSKWDLAYNSIKSFFKFKSPNFCPNDALANFAQNWNFARLTEALGPEFNAEHVDDRISAIINIRKSIEESLLSLDMVLNNFAEDYVKKIIFLYERIEDILYHPSLQPLGHIFENQEDTFEDSKRAALSLAKEAINLKLETEEFKHQCIALLKLLHIAISQKLNKFKLTAADTGKIINILENEANIFNQLEIKSMYEATTCKSMCDCLNLCIKKCAKFLNKISGAISVKLSGKSFSKTAILEANQKSASDIHLFLEESEVVLEVYITYVKNKKHSSAEELVINKFGWTDSSLIPIATYCLKSNPWFISNIISCNSKYILLLLLQQQEQDKTKMIFAYIKFNEYEAVSEKQVRYIRDLKNVLKSKGMVADVEGPLAFNGSDLVVISCGSSGFIAFYMEPI